jgi:hypothetical protein
MNGEEIEARTWETTYDLVAIPDFSEKDLFSSLLNTKVMRLYHKLWGSKHHVSLNLAFPTHISMPDWT